MSRCVDGRTNPALWERSKRKAIARLNGRFSARAMQLAAKLYRNAGGDYCGRKSSAQRSMTKWTREKWTTAPEAEKVACKKVRGKVVCDRYLPASAWKHLTPAQRKATRAKKQSGRGQWILNTSAAQRAGSKARRR